ncbi:hypothetical protein SOVF_140240, partial [Spinacia oleracea]
VEEAKKRMYACSTTTYTGFQAEVDEETSQKFEGMPGVVFVLPDSYIDPVNKEYGGDKYINGTIIPRPPPVQYGRERRNSQRPMPNSMPGERRANMPQRGFPERQNTSFNYGPTGQGGRTNPMPNRTNYSEQGRDGYQGGGNTYVPPQQGGGDTYLPPQQGNFNLGYSHQHQMENFPGYRGNNHPGEHGYNDPQGQMSNFPRNHGDYAPQGHVDYPSDGRNYAPPPPARGADGQTGVGQYGQGSSGTFAQIPDEQNYSPAIETGMNQRRF